MFTRALKGLPYENMSKKYPKIATKINDYFLCKTFNTFPQEGGLANQYIEDYNYFTLFTSIFNEHSQDS